MKFRKVFLPVIAAGVLAVSAGSAFAGEADIKYRKSVMKAVGGHMTSMSQILKGEAGNMKDISAHADAMAGLAQAALSAFPKDSSKMDGDTEATMDVWDKHDEFKKVAMAFVDHSNKLAEAAKSGDKGTIGSALGALGKNACKACHDGFREKK